MNALCVSYGLSHLQLFTYTSSFFLLTRQIFTQLTLSQSSDIRFKIPWGEMDIEILTVSLSIPNFLYCNAYI